MTLPSILFTIAGSFAVRFGRFNTACRSAYWKGTIEKLGGKVGTRLHTRKGVSFTVAHDGARSGKVIIGNEVVFAADVHVFVGPHGKLNFGDGVFIGRGSTIVANEAVQIGNGSQIAHGVTIIDSDHRFGDPIKALIEQGAISKPVSIGEHCWLGTGVIVLKGVTIGDRSVVGAGSIVTDSIAEKSLAAGNPAQVRRALIP